MSFRKQVSKDEWYWANRLTDALSSWSWCFNVCITGLSSSLSSSVWATSVGVDTGCSDCHEVWVSVCHPPSVSPPRDGPITGRSRPVEALSKGDRKLDSAVVGRIVAVSEKLAGMLSRKPGERSCPNGCSSSSSSSAVCAGESRGSLSNGLNSLELAPNSLLLELYEPSELKCSDVLPNAWESVAANGVAQGSGERRCFAKGSANGLSSRACREGASRSSKPSMKLQVESARLSRNYH